MYIYIYTYVNIYIYMYLMQTTYTHLPDKDAPRHVHVGHARSALDQHKRQLLPSLLLPPWP